MATAKSRHAAATKLYRWRWRGTGVHQRPMHGVLVGHTKHDVIQQLASQRIANLRIKREYRWRQRGDIREADIVLFARQMATMCEANIPLHGALTTVLASINKLSLLEIIEQVANDVADGDSFSMALARHPKYFDRLFIGLVAAGEQSGNLAHTLAQVATYKEQQMALKQRVTKALWYPAVVLAIGLAVTLILLLKVVPEFENMFSGFGTVLPAPTQLVLNVSENVQRYWLTSLASLALAGMLLRISAQKSARVAALYAHFALCLPLLGRLFYHAALARFSRTLATTLSAGVPLVEGLHTAIKATDNRSFSQAIDEVRQDVTTGQRLHTAMQLTNRFPSLAIQMVAVGEESGDLANMLVSVAGYYEDALALQVDTLTSLLEPIIIVILGTLVGGVVIAMYLPIFEIGTAL